MNLKYLFEAMRGKIRGVKIHPNLKISGIQIWANKRMWLFFSQSY